jgi:hypothetical protein
MTRWDLTNTHLYGDTLEAARDEWLDLPSSDLVDAITNNALNGFIAHNIYRDVDGDNSEPAIPFHGWYWRNVNFYKPNGITIAEGDGLIGVCQNNKWDHAERDLTISEAGEFRGLVWLALKSSHNGGVLSEIIAETRTKLTAAGDFIRSLVV